MNYFDMLPNNVQDLILNFKKNKEDAIIKFMHLQKEIEYFQHEIEKNNKSIYIQNLLRTRCIGFLREQRELYKQIS